MELIFTQNELKQLIIWAENSIQGGHFGGGNVVFPEEKGVYDRLIKIERSDQDNNFHFDVEKRDLKCIKIWAENTLGSTLKGLTGEEISLVNKMERADQELKYGKV